jgi:c-di-GMP-binding flagellar brake protein YcgR
MDQPLKPSTLRRYPRYKIDIRVRLTRGQSDQSSVVYGRGTDVGRGGMAVFADIGLGIGEIVYVDFPLLSSPQPLKVTATVRNRNQFRYGLEFMDVVEAERDQIVRMCEFLSPAD